MSFAVDTSPHWSDTCPFLVLGIDKEFEEHASAQHEVSSL